MTNQQPTTPQSSRSSKKTIKFNWNPQLFNTIFWLLRAAFNDVTKRFIWAYGGSSASKTYSVVQLLIIEMLASKENTALIFRKFSVDIDDSIFADFKTIINDWNLNEYFIVQKHLIKCKVTGAYIRFRGLDDSEKVKGIAGFKRIILEEISQFDEVDLKQIRKRLRGKKGQQIICLFNPVSDQHWIKTNVFDLEELVEVESPGIAAMWHNKQGNTVIMQTNYLDNKYIVGEFKDGVQVGGFVDQHTIDDFEKDKRTDYNYYRVYGLGEWGKIRTGGEFWKDINTNVHMTKRTWDEELPLHISWDENVNPYLTCLVWQIIPVDYMQVNADGTLERAHKKIARQIDELCLVDPRNRVRHVCAEFRARFPQARVKGLYVYGDRTSIKEDTKEEKGENFFTKILQELADYRPQLRMQSVNPSIVQSAGFVNACYRGDTDLAIEVHDRCKKSLHDYQYALEDSDGTLKKNKIKHPVTGVTYEEFGHPSDAKRYFLTVAFAGDYAKYLAGGKKLLPKVGRTSTRHGY